MQVIGGAGRRALLLGAGAAGVAGAALGQPGGGRPALDRLARIIAGFPPGGTLDVMARLTAERIRGSYAPQVIVENRVGAAGRIAVEAMRTLEADGTAVLLTPASMITIFPHLYAGRLRYDPFADLAPVTPICVYPFGLAVGPALPGVTTLAGFLDAARARPGGLAYASPAAGSSPHFLGTVLARAAGVELTHVPYRGAAPAIQDLLAGNLPCTTNVLGDLVPHHQAGRVRILAVTAEQRLSRLPEVPTFAELGYPGLTSDEWYGLFLPARAPSGAIAALNAAAGEAVRDPGMQAAFAQQEFAPAHLSPEAFAARIRAEHAKWGPIVAASGFRAEE